MVQSKAAVTVPSSMHYVAILYQLVPRALGAFINDLLGASELTKTAK